MNDVGEAPVVKEVKTITELKRLRPEDFKASVIQGVVLSVPGLFGKMSGFTDGELKSENMSDDERADILAAFRREGFSMPRSANELDRTLKYIYGRMDKFGPPPE